MRSLRSSTLIVSALLSVASVPALAQQRDEVVRVILPFAGGGSGDGLTRIIADQLSAGLKRPAIVELRPGAAGRIGIRAVKDAAPDGNTLLMVPIAPMTVYQDVYSSLGYDPFKDFQPIAQVARFEFGVAAGPATSARTLAELVQWLKDNPEKANYGTPGAGTLPHFLGVMFSRAAGVELHHVTYKGGAAAVKDLIGGQIPIVFSSTNEFVELHKSGLVRVLATSDKERSPFLPEVPTFRETGYDLHGTGWFGLFAPANTPPETVAHLNELIVAALGRKDVQDSIMRLGLQPTRTSAEAFARIQRADLELWSPAVKASGFTPDQ